MGYVNILEGKSLGRVLNLRMDKYYIQPGRQVCIVPIYLTTIYERCQLIDLELKMITNEVL